MAATDLISSYQACFVNLVSGGLGRSNKVLLKRSTYLFHSYLLQYYLYIHCVKLKISQLYTLISKWNCNFEVNTL